MSTITTRAGKGSPLTNSEVDQNFTNLNNDKLESVSESDVTQHQAALSITESQISDLQSYLTSETSHADVLVDGDFTSSGFMKTDGAGNYTVDSNTYLTSYTVTESDVTAHQAALSITESQIIDLTHYTDTDVETYLANNDFDTATNIVASITDSAPATLDTLNELAAALGDDPNFATTVSTSIGTKVSKAGDTMTGALLMDGAIVKSTVNTVAASTAATTVDFTASNFHVINMSANTTFTFSNLASCVTSTGTLVIKQDATGGRTFTLPAVCKTPVGGAAIVQSTGANSTAIISYLVVSSTEVLVNYIGDFA